MGNWLDYCLVQWLELLLDNLKAVWLVQSLALMKVVGLECLSVELLASKMAVEKACSLGWIMAAWKVLDLELKLELAKVVM